MTPASCSHIHTPTPASLQLYIEVTGCCCCCWLQEYVNATYQCVQKDKAIDLKKCPQDRLLVTTNYDLRAAEPGKGTLANESDAVLAAAAATGSSKSAAGVSRRGAGLGSVLGVLLAAAAAAVLTGGLCM
jgi:hypothetical protein